MKRISVVALMLFATAGVARAEALFRGHLEVTSATTGCPFGQGTHFNGLFHPMSVPGNSNFSALNRIDDFEAQSYDLAGGNFTSAFKLVSNIRQGWNSFTPSKPTFLKVTSQAPATQTVTTPNVTLVGQLKNPKGNAGEEACIIGFRFVGVLSD